MDGIIKKIVLFFLFLTFAVGCKKNEKMDMDTVINNLTAEGRALIKQNSNVLIDSLENSDVSSVSTLLPKKKLKPFSVALRDSILITDRFSDYKPAFTTIAFKLENSDLSRFKSPYKLRLVNKEVSETNVLYVSFLNFKIKNDEAEIVVIKSQGVGAVIDRYYFKKQKAKWVFTKKRQLSMS